MIPPGGFAPLVVSTGNVAFIAVRLMLLVGQFNRATDGTMVVRSEYLEIVISKR